MKWALIIDLIDFDWWMEIFCMQFLPTFRHCVGHNDDVLPKKIEVEGVIEMFWSWQNCSLSYLGTNAAAGML